MGTLSLVSRLTGESCVKQISIPDPMIMQGLKGNKKKVMLSPETENSFYIMLDADCDDYGQK